MPVSKPYHFHPEAWQELESADNWYRQRNPEASIRFLAAVYEALEDTARWPHTWFDRFDAPSSHFGTIPTFEELSHRTVLRILDRQGVPSWQRDGLGLMLPTPQGTFKRPNLAAGNCGSSRFGENLVKPL